jgi:ketosteroid isomerase-like protein
MKKIILFVFSIVLLATSFTSCTRSEPSVLSEADKTAISKATNDINQAFNATKDYKAYANAYYAEDATVLYPNSEAVIGRDAIIIALSNFGTTMNVYPTIKDINGKDDLAYVYGTVKMETDAKVELDHGKYLEIWKKQKDGKWQVIYDIFNTSIPMASDTTKTQN